MPLHLVSVDEHSPAQRLGLEPGCSIPLRRISL